MPYRFERLKTRLPRSADRRRRLNDDDRRAIVENRGHLSQRALARLYGVSRRLIQLIRDPAKVAQQAACREARGGWRRYYDKGAHTESVRDYRRHKARVLGRASCH